ncbi:MAG: carboxypeptidase family protein [Rhodospirillaceae bacterium]|jgi:murein tripeptide amidase MpaA|nr:carboxypeptidase family protein [Rhodospirillaceae bacterium]MBT3926803.1 carboxypeptidase family protein [Rhodospirillaceae bacterium]MBT4425871.1 carboxypeptidase family protein [Rhodospirillaceae bacterium]MBT5039705.1 carboxypeptidase family protein [Rhodospirillaceae bacterium]MBT5674893.1 carboxypeptidase family protein [Rhodospirillaceae bacterium]
MKISSAFDGGNITCVKCDKATDIQLEIRNDQDSEFFQWFYFRLSGAGGQACKLKIVNAGEAAYPKGWENYRAVASYDRIDWFRVPTDYNGKILTIRHKPEQDSVYYAYFAPYAMERHHDLVAHCLQYPRTALEVLGETVDGQEIDLLTIGEGMHKKHKIWAIARQHPGESMAEWWMEGFLERLLDQDDAVARALLDKAVFHIVPNMNPDGSRRGHLRTNAAGINLNREWQEPSREKSPEVYWVRQRMEKTGVDFCLDVHGDEAIPHNFIAGPEGVPSFSKRQAKLLKNYKDALLQANPDFQLKHGYPANRPGKANLKIGANWIAERFGCLSMTLEMPFKDVDDGTEQRQGWSPARSRALGRSNLDAIRAVLGNLR